MRLNRAPNFGVRLGTLFNTKANAWPELTWSGLIARVIKFVNAIPMPVAHTAEEVMVNMLFIEMRDGRHVCFDQSAAQLSGIRFSDNGKEPSR